MHPTRDHKRLSETCLFGGKESHRFLNSCYIFITTSRVGMKTPGQLSLIKKTLIWQDGKSCSNRASAASLGLLCGKRSGIINQLFQHKQLGGNK